MLQNLVVVAAYDKEYIQGCLDSLGKKHKVVVIDTSKGGYPTWGYIRAFRRYKAHNYLFIQDTMLAKDADYLQSFIDKRPRNGAVAWCLFHMGFDSGDQTDYAHSLYAENPPEYGIFGPVFYISRKALLELEYKGLLPPKPTNKMEAQTSERLWAWALQNAGMELTSVGGLWDHDAMQRGDYPVFKKVFANRK
jgi:hypothetical protein